MIGSEMDAKNNNAPITHNHLTGTVFVSNRGYRPHVRLVAEGVR